MERRPLSATDGYDNHSPLLSPSLSSEAAAAAAEIDCGMGKGRGGGGGRAKEPGSLSLSRIGTFLVPSLREPSGIRIPPCGYNDWEADNGD